MCVCVCYYTFLGVPVYNLIHPVVRTEFSDRTL